MTCHLTVFYVIASYFWNLYLAVFVGWLKYSSTCWWVFFFLSFFFRKITRVVYKNLRKYIWECFCLHMWTHFIIEFLAYNFFPEVSIQIALLISVIKELIKELNTRLIFPLLLLPPFPTSSILPWCNKGLAIFLSISWALLSVWIFSHIRKVFF